MADQFDAGARHARLQLLQHLLQEIDRDSPAWGRARLIVERERAVAVLRSACSMYGDTSLGVLWCIWLWADDLDLADIIEKHLVYHLRTPAND